MSFTLGQIVALMDDRTDPRKIKRFERGLYSPLYEAYNRGECDAYYNRSYLNPYPAGARHKEYERGYKLCDPMGDAHGRNV